jgi:hypothetical protein
MKSARTAPFQASGCSDCEELQQDYRCHSCQFGRTSAPMVPHLVQTMRRPNDGEIAGQMVDVADHTMTTLVALDIERPHAGLPHVLQRHRLERFVRARHHSLSDRMSASVGDYKLRDAERPAACSHASRFGGHVTGSDQLIHLCWANTPRAQCREGTSMWCRRKHLQRKPLFNRQARARH